MSIDGGHTAIHTMNDLKLASNLISNEGIVILDDILNHRWIGVLEGLVKFLQTTPTLVPVMMGHNKLYLVKLSYQNKRLSYYIDKLGLPHRVIFQNDLTVEITQLGQDLDFDNLSRGERNRLILSMSFAFRDVWEGLYHPINLLFIDELIDAGMDAAGVESALAVLKKMARERNKNIYLISHKDELIGRVNNVLRVIKENGFTSYNNADYVE